jgi:hypothetical protein
VVQLLLKRGLDVMAKTRERTALRKSAIARREFEGMELCSGLFSGHGSAVGKINRSAYESTSRPISHFTFAHSLATIGNHVPDPVLAFTAFTV